MELKSKKRLRSVKHGDGVDRLSEMPDEVIVHILSFLPILEAARTVLLSRFGNLWTLVPSLSFDYYSIMCMLNPDGWSEDDDFEHFPLFVRNVLMLHRRPTIDKFQLYLDDQWFDDDKVGKDVRMWLRFALGREAKELHFFGDCDGDLEYPVMPVFTSQSLVKLVLRCCTIKQQHRVHLGSLKELHLEHVDVCNEAFQNFISGCPSLQELRLEHLTLQELRFTAPNIVKLYLSKQYEYHFVVDSLDCPNLKFLDIDAPDLLPDLVDVSSVREFSINSIPRCNAHELKNFLRKLENAESFKLTVKTSYDENFFSMIKNLDPPQNRWKRLVLNVWRFTADCLLGFYKLARSLGHLEELIIYTAGHQESARVTTMLPLNLSSPCLLPKLKTVTMHGYEKTLEVQLQLIKFLFKSAVVLDTFCVVPGQHQLTAAEELDFLKRVLRLQRTSRNVKIVFT